MNSPQFYAFPSPAKINLFLHITGQRNDGYHNLETAFQFLDYEDTLHFAVTEHIAIELLTPIAGVTNEENLIMRAATALQQATNTRLGAQIKIDKRLPMGGGIGGGSSNAATVLLVLNTLWQTQLTIEQLADIGLKLGADVPIFIHGFAAFATGVGEHLTAIAPEQPYYLISKPDVSISTQSVFTSPDLTRNTSPLDLDHLDINSCHNDCQKLVIKQYPEVANLLAWLVEYAPSRMTGTGACIFSRFETKEQAEYVQQQLPENISSFVAKGVNKSPLHQALAMFKQGQTQ